MAIPTRILEQINSSELNAADYYAVYGKQEIEDSLAKLRQSDQEILNKYKPEQMRAKIESKLNKKPVILNANFIRYAQFAAAAAFLCAIIIPASMRAKSNSNPIAAETIVESTTKTNSETIRIKGNANVKSTGNHNPSINLYRQDGDKITTLSNGAFAKSGDVIQITYNAGNKEYGVIFSVDGNGNITRHFPENSWQAEALEHDFNETPLDFSYELDNAPDFECFIMVTSKQQFTLDDLEDKIKNKTDIDYLKKLSYLPKKTDGITFVLDK